MYPLHRQIDTRNRINSHFLTNGRDAPQQLANQNKDTTNHIGQAHNNLPFSNKKSITHNSSSTTTNEETVNKNK